MWFKNIHLYKVEQDFDYDPEGLADQLAELGFTPCSQFTPQTQGWEAPLDQEDAPLVHGAMGFMMLCLKQEEKLIPAYVVNEQVKERVALIEEQEGRKVGRKEAKTIKDELFFKLLPQAFSKHTRTYAYFDTQEKWLIVNASSAKKAENFVDHLRKTLGRLKVILPDVPRPALQMTRWLMEQDISQPFAIEDNCVLQDFNDKSSLVRCQGQDLFAENIQAFIEQGSEVMQLKISWAQQVSFVLKDDLSLRGIRLLDLAEEQRDDAFTETPAERFDADFAIMTQTFRKMVKDLMDMLDKSDKPAPVKKSADIKAPEPA